MKTYNVPFLVETRQDGGERETVIVLPLPIAPFGAGETAVLKLEENGVTFRFSDGSGFRVEDVPAETLLTLSDVEEAVLLEMNAGQPARAWLVQMETA